MAKKITSVVGIDVGSQAIKVAELRLKGGEPEISAIGLIETPEGAVDHTGVYNSDAVGDALKQCLSQSGATVGSAIISISGQASVLVRTLEVPRMNATELKEHMQWEINRNIPFAESNVLSDYRALTDEDENSPNMDVVMAIAPQSAVDTLVACVKRAGRNAVGIDVEPLALARSIQASYAEELEHQVVCIVDLGHKTTSINIYRNGKLLMPRQIPIGGENFTKAISDGLHLSLEEAEQRKREVAAVPQSAIEAAKSGGFSAPAFGMPAPALGAETQQFQAYNPFSDDPIPTSNPFLESPAAIPAEDATPVDPFALPSIDPFAAAPPAAAPGVAFDEDPELIKTYNAFANVLEEFIAEVRRSIDYFRSKGGEVNVIHLAGGGAQLKGLADYVAASVGLECTLYDPFRRLLVNDRKVAPGYVDEHRQEFAVAVGTALHVFYD